MRIGIVKGQVVSTEKSERLEGIKLLVVQPYDIDAFTEKGQPFVSLDSVGAGDGDVVIVVSGSSARNADNMKDRPVDSCIIGIVDSIDLRGKLIYRKTESKESYKDSYKGYKERTIKTV